MPLVKKGEIGSYLEVGPFELSERVFSETECFLNSV